MLGLQGRIEKATGDASVRLATAYYKRLLLSGPEERRGAAGPVIDSLREIIGSADATTIAKQLY